MKKILKNHKFWLVISLTYLLVMVAFVFTDAFQFTDTLFSTDGKKEVKLKYPKLNKKDYDARLHFLAGYSTTTYAELLAATTTSTSTKKLWPVKTDYPKDGAILPFKRVIAYYGNLLSTKMGALGEYPEDEMLRRLNIEVEKWNKVDPTTPAIPALHYIAVTAQARAGEDGKYRLRMSDTEIEKVLRIAEKANAIVFLDIQVGQSTIQEELPLLEKYLKLPNVHLGLDPEFSMKFGRLPGVYVGTYDATEINYVTDYLAKLVTENDLPPKIFVVHRYTQNMLTNYQNIKTTPEVQIVIHMDGWGQKSNKLASQLHYVYKEPVQFTGFKLFYKNDLWKPSAGMMTPEEVFKEVKPTPVYIQYQ